VFSLSAKHLPKWISCGIALGLLAASHILAAAEVKHHAVNERQTSAGQSPRVQQQESQESKPPLIAAPARSSVSLAPAIVTVRCKFSQSYVQILTLTNQTQQEFVFEMVAQDVVVRDGKRSFIPAGETAGGIAATAVFTQKQVVVKPGQSASVGVTFTVPPDTPLRAAIALFRGLTQVSTGAPVMMTASLGALFVFTVSENSQIKGLPVEVTAQTPTASLRISQVLTNSGSEPTIAHGVAAVLNETGMLVGKVSFEEQRLLPGEQLPFQAEYPAELKTGRYRVFASFQYEKKTITSSADFVVP
jgi:hypothetical protein